MESNQILTLRDNAKNQLLQLKTVEDGITYMNKLKSIETWVKAEKKDAELQNIVAEQKLRTQRILGELIADGQRKGFIATQSLNGGGIQAGLPDQQTRKNIPEFGLSHKQSSTFQQIAEIPEEAFEEFIQEKKEAVKNAVAELTTSGAVRLAKSLKQINSEKEYASTQKVAEHAKQTVRELAEHINQTYTKEQKNLLISLINQ